MEFCKYKNSQWCFFRIQQLFNLDLHRRGRCGGLPWTWQRDRRRHQRHVARNKYRPVRSFDDNDDLGLSTSDNDALDNSDKHAFVDGRYITDITGLSPSLAGDLNASYSSSEHVRVRGAMLLLLIEDAKPSAAETNSKEFVNYGGSCQDAAKLAAVTSPLECLAPGETSAAETQQTDKPPGVRAQRRQSGRFSVETVEEKEEGTPQRRKVRGKSLFQTNYLHRDRGVSHSLRWHGVHIINGYADTQFSKSRKMSQKVLACLWWTQVFIFVKGLTIAQHCPFKPRWWEQANFVVSKFRILRNCVNCFVFLFTACEQIESFGEAAFCFYLESYNFLVSLSTRKSLCTRSMEKSK